MNIENTSLLYGWVGLFICSLDFMACFGLTFTEKGKKDMVDFATKKQHYIKEINKIAKESFNDEQKELVRGILDSATEANIDSLYTFVTQRVKTGFVFDAAPEVAHNCISLCERDNKRSFGNESGVHHKLIIGENYDVLKNLVATYTKNGKGLIDVIYIDPPYNTEKTAEDGNDYKNEVKSEKFVYRDKFSRVGWLNMMKERLELARKLLSDRGVIFISIDDNEQAYLKVLCDEIFGENNFLGTLIIQTATDNNKSQISTEHEYMLGYSRNSSKLNAWEVPTDKGKLIQAKYQELRETISDAGEIQKALSRWIRQNRDVLRGVEHYKYVDEQGVFYPGNPSNTKDGDYKYDIIHPVTGKICKKPEKGYRWPQNTFNAAAQAGNVLWGEDETVIPKIKKRLDTATELLKSVYYEDGRIGTKVLEQIIGKNKFDHPKSKELLKRILKFASNKDSIVLDFFGGSGTTMQAVMELNIEDDGNRQCILVTNNENNIATNVTYERIYRIVNGKGTNNEKFKWVYTKDKPYLTDNYVDVFNTNSYELKIDDYDKSQELLDKARVEFKKLNPNYEWHDLDIYNHLASLKPYKKN
ncbi:MAG: site-specific DNA-methyltransferase [Alphaproteobacteria bacterium]|nr:site-specific DNA-methyltransferase [Alphaproteobacteria bacterium]